MALEGVGDKKAESEGTDSRNDNGKDASATSTASNGSPDQGTSRAEVLAHALKDAMQINSAQSDKKASTADADREFTQRVRNLAAQLKAMAEKEEKRLQQTAQPVPNQEINRIHQTLNDIGEITSAVETVGVTPTYAVNVFA